VRNGPTLTPAPTPHAGEVWLGGRHGVGVRQYADWRRDPGQARSGTWAVVAEFDGPIHAWKLDRVHDCDGGQGCVIPPTPAPRVSLPRPDQWRSSLSRAQYGAAVEEIRRRIRAGQIAQANLGRILGADAPAVPPARAVYEHLRAHHPAPYGGWVDIAVGPGPGAWLVSASPELALALTRGTLRTRPIKGTATEGSQLRAKDYRENRLVAEALRREVAAAAGAASLTDSCRVERHPGMVQLVSEVCAPLGAAGGPALARLLRHLLPPLSVSGVPRTPATAVIRSLEPERRGPYCGALGWVDVDAGEALLAATIRSFWWSRGVLRFGTGAGITAASDPDQEWAETELKAGRLLDLLGRWRP